MVTICGTWLVDCTATRGSVMYLYPEHCTKNMYKCTFFLHILCPVHFKLWQLTGLRCSGHKNMSNCQEKKQKERERKKKRRVRERERNSTLFSVTTACTLIKVGKFFYVQRVH